MRPLTVCLAALLTLSAAAFGQFDCQIGDVNPAIVPYDGVGVPLGTLEIDCVVDELQPLGTPPRGDFTFFSNTILSHESLTTSAARLLFAAESGTPIEYIGIPHGLSGVKFPGVELGTGTYTPTGLFGSPGLTSGEDVDIRVEYQSEGGDLKVTVSNGPAEFTFTLGLAIGGGGPSRPRAPRTNVMSMSRDDCSPQSTNFGGRFGSTAPDMVCGQDDAACLEIAEGHSSAFPHGNLAGQPPRQGDGSTNRGKIYCAEFDDIPRRSSLLVSNSSIGSGPTVVRVESDRGEFSAVAATTQVNIGGEMVDFSLLERNGRGEARACWEIVDSDPDVEEMVRIATLPVWASDGTLAGSPPSGTAMVTFRKAPLIAGRENLFDESIPTPAYVDRNGNQIGDPDTFPLFSVESCGGGNRELRLGGGFPQNLTLVINAQQGGNIGDLPEANIPILSEDEAVRLSVRTTAFRAAPPAQGTGPQVIATLSDSHTPAALNVVTIAEGLPVGEHRATITVTGTGARNSPLTIPVVVRVTEPAPFFTAEAFVNAAGYQPGVVSPGEAFVIFGQRFGPAGLAGLELGDDGRITTEAGETRVLFDGVPSPMIFAINGQLSGFAPFSLAGSSTTQVQVEYQGVLSRAVRMPVLDATPGIFTLDQTGGGQAAALNQDGTFNTPVTPANGSDVLTFYGSGPGQTNPAGTDGRPAGTPLPELVLPVEVFIGGEPADVVYAGPAPGLSEGVLQVNARASAVARLGARTPLWIKVGDRYSQPGVILSYAP